MKKTLLLLLGLAVLISCDKRDSNTNPQSNVVSDQSLIKFEELVVLMNIKTSDTSYLLVKSIDSVNIYVNNTYWARLNSYSIDTSKVTHYAFGNMTLTGIKQDYLVIAKQDKPQANLTTAGQFSAYLNSLYDLKPGEYACFIESFKVTFNDNTTHKYYPYAYKIFKVEDNTISASAGEFEFKI